MFLATMLSVCLAARTVTATVETTDQQGVYRRYI